MILNTRTYTEYRTSPDSIVYAGPANTATLKDLFEQRRVLPKVSSNGNGVSRPSLKFVKGVNDAATGANHDVIFTIGASIPAQAVVTTAIIEGMVADLASHLGTTAGKALFTSNAIRA